MTTLFLSDDHITMRDGLGMMLAATGEFEIIGKADDGKQTKAAFESGIKADVLILDINMPGMDGYETALWLKEHRPKVAVIIFSMYDTNVSMMRLLEIGVKGVLKKDVSFETLTKAINIVAAGDYYFDDSANAQIVSLFEKGEDGKRALDKSSLSDKDIECLKLLSTDMPYKEIADKMELSYVAIEGMRQSMFARLNVKSRVGLAIYAVKNGIVRF